MTLTSLRGCTAVVTGAGSGVGQSIAIALAAEGVRLRLVGRTPEKLEATARALGADASACSYPTDLADDASLLALAQRLREDDGAVDILVHAAGDYAPGALETQPVAELDALHRTNVRAPYLLTQALLPLLREREGQLVFINSSVGLRSAAGVGSYAASKHALRALADSFREELNPVGIRVLSIFLGRTASPMQERIHALEGKAYHPDSLLQPSDVAEVVVNALRLPRSAEMTEVSLRPMRAPLRR